MSKQAYELIGTKLIGLDQNGRSLHNDPSTWVTAEILLPTINPPTYKTVFR